MSPMYLALSDFLLYDVQHETHHTSVMTAWLTANEEQTVAVSHGEICNLLQASKTWPFESFNLFARTVLNVRLE